MEPIEYISLTISIAAIAIGFCALLCILWLSSKFEGRFKKAGLFLSLAIFFIVGEAILGLIINYIYNMNAPALLLIHRTARLLGVSSIFIAACLGKKEIDKILRHFEKK